MLDSRSELEEQLRHMLDEMSRLIFWDTEDMNLEAQKTQEMASQILK